VSRPSIFALDDFRLIDTDQADPLTTGQQHRQRARIAMTSNENGRPAKPLRRALGMLIILALVGIAPHLIAPTLNGFKLAGVPLGFAVSAQIGPVVLALMMFWIASRKVKT
jgi:putative solute:sodium symporter small subunit